MKILIIGSCVSRDIINLPDAKNCEISLYIARSSLASMFSPVPFKDEYSEKIKSPFQRRLVEWDIKKKSVDRLRAASADVVMVDSIDERFNIASFQNGGRCTLSSELMSTKMEIPPSAKMIRAGTPLFMEWWTAGWLQLIEILEEKKLKEKILINKVFCQKKTEKGIEFDGNRVDRINDLLSKIYETQSKSLPSNQFIEYNNALTCPDDHQWGPSPFHFNEASQLLALKKVKEVAGNNQ
ncbi:DUF6270 domain-containing protein [Alcaligenes faecalis]|nr:DUF6270 domain-containing protein [Alcaligenes faecalis]